MCRIVYFQGVWVFTEYPSIMIVYYLVNYLHSLATTPAMYICFSIIIAIIRVSKISITKACFYAIQYFLRLFMHLSFPDKWYVWPVGLTPHGFNTVTYLPHLGAALLPLLVLVKKENILHTMMLPPLCFTNIFKPWHLYTNKPIPTQFKTRHDALIQINGSFLWLPVAFIMPACFN